MKKLIFLLSFLPSFLFSQTEFTGLSAGKCNIQQTGSGAGYWTVGIAQFNNPRGMDATYIAEGDVLYFNDSGVSFALPVDTVLSAVGNSASVRVLNSGITTISSVPTTAAGIAMGTSNYKIPPFFANMTDNNNQMVVEWAMYVIDSLIANAGGDILATRGRVDSISLLQDSIIVSYDNEGNEISRDTIATAGGGGGSGTDLSYTQATRLLASSTGADVTLPLATTALPGIMPAVSGLGSPGGGIDPANDLLLLGDASSGSIAGPSVNSVVQSVAAGGDVTGTINNLTVNEASGTVSGKIKALNSISSILPNPTDSLTYWDENTNAYVRTTFQAVIDMFQDSTVVANQLSKRSNGSIGLGNITGTFGGADAPTANVTIPISSTYYTRFGNASNNNMLYLWGGTNPGIGFGTTTTTSAYPYQFGSGLSLQSNLQLQANVRDNRDNTLLSQSASGVTSNRDLTIGGSTYGRVMFNGKGLQWSYSGTYVAFDSTVVYFHGGTRDPGSTNSGMSMYFRPQTPDAAANANGGDFIISLPSGAGTGVKGKFRIYDNVTEEVYYDAADWHWLTYNSGRSFQSTYRGVLVATTAGKIDLADKDVVSGAVTSFNAQTGTTYTLVAGDVGKTISMTNAASNTLTVPPNSSVAFAVGTRITVYQGGAGQTTFAPGAGVTINSADSALNLRVIYSTATLTKTATDTWLLAGDITP